MMTIPYVHSNYERKDDDNYMTIDKRCVYGLLEHFQPVGLCVDVCARNGSNIVDTLHEFGHAAIGIDDAFTDIVDADWIITNPPYRRNLVDDIVQRQVKRIYDGEVQGVAMLLRTNFDHAKSRTGLFVYNQVYAGQVKLLFRPWWSEERTSSPIHNYVWHIWYKGFDGEYPYVWYSKGDLKCQ